MSNTKNILLVTAIISILVMGTSVPPTQTNAQTQKDTQGEKKSIQKEQTHRPRINKQVRITCV